MVVNVSAISWHADGRGNPCGVGHGWAHASDAGAHPLSAAGVQCVTPGLVPPQQRTALSCSPCSVKEAAVLCVQASS